MLRSYRSILAAFAGLALLCSVYNPNQGHAAETSTGDPGEQVTEAPAIAAATQVPAPASPAPNLASATRDQAYYDREDLKAQRDMAKWTRIMGIAAIVGTVVGVVGIGLVWTTFREAKRSADAAHTANRPWLELEPVVCQGLTFGDYGARFDITLRIKNLGNSPATNVMVITHLVPVPIDGGIDGAAAVNAVRDTINNLRVHDRQLGRVAFPGAHLDLDHGAIASEETVLEADQLSPGNVIYQLGMGVRYRFGEALGETVYGFIIVDMTSSDLALPRGRNVMGGNIRLDDTYTGYAT